MRDFIKHGIAVPFFKRQLTKIILVLFSFYCSVAEVWSLTFVLIHRLAKTQVWDNLTKIIFNFLNISETLRFVDLFLTKIKSAFFTSIHPGTFLVASTINNAMSIYSVGANSVNLPHRNDFNPKGDMRAGSTFNNSDFDVIVKQSMRIENQLGLVSQDVYESINGFGYLGLLQVSFPAGIEASKECGLSDGETVEGQEENVSITESIDIEKDKYDDDNILCTDQLDSYLTYLENQIYQHQLKIAPDLEIEEGANQRSKRKRMADKLVASSRIGKKLRSLQRAIDDVFQSLRYIARPMISKYSIQNLYLLFCFFAVSPALGQEPIKLKALEIGQRVPEELWSMTFLANNTQENPKTFRLKDYKGKLILLDFWATWCASCINGFPKMEELQKAYGDEVKIVLVNAKQSKDSYSRVRQVLERYKSLYGYEIGLDYLLGDSTLEQYFPHQILPHLIWIDKEGVLRAASYGKSATMLNVDRALQGDYTQIHQKQDYIYDKEHFLISDLHVDRVLSRRVLTAYIEGLGIKSETVVKQDGQNYYQIWNKHLRSLYFAAFEDEFRGITADRYQFDVAIDSAWVKSFVASANVNNKYCYETLLPDEGTEKDGRFQLSQDLLSYFGYKPIRKNIYTEVLKFSQSQKLNNYVSQGGIPRVQFDENEGEMYLRNSTLQSLYFFIAARLNLPFESVLDAGYRIDLTLPDNFLNYSPNQIIQYLESIGVVVERESKKIDIVQFIKI